MNTLNKWIRIIHRWLVVPFTLTIVLLLIGNIAQRGTYEVPNWLGLIGILSIILLALTGVFMFAKYYWSTWQRKLRRSKRIKA